MSEMHEYHDHALEERKAFYMDQLFTIGVCGALGAVGLTLWYHDKLMFLAPFLRPFILGSSAGLLVLVAVRAVVVWNSVAEPENTPVDEHDHEHHHHEHGECCSHQHQDHHGQEQIQVAVPTGVTPGNLNLNVLSSPPAPPAAQANHHDHDHGHTHNHGHAPHHPGHEHGHDHDHEHGFAPWRYVFLLLPVALFFLDLPQPQFSSAQTSGVINADSVEVTGLKEEGGIKVHEGVSFLQLERFAMDPTEREGFAGQRVRLVGQYRGDDDKRFTLVRYKRNCCAADAIALNAIIVLDNSKMPEPNKAPRLEPTKLRNKWVQVEGVVQFLKRKGTEDYVTALIVAPTKDRPLSELIKIVPAPADPYVY